MIPVSVKYPLAHSIQHMHVCTVHTHAHMGGCQNYDPFWGTINIRCRIIIGTQKGTIILTTTHILVTQVHVKAFSLHRFLHTKRCFLRFGFRRLPKTETPKTETLNPKP